MTSPTNDYGTIGSDEQEKSETEDGIDTNNASFLEKHLNLISNRRFSLYHVLFVLAVQYAAMFGCFNYTMMSWGSLTPELTCLTQTNLTTYCDVLGKCDNFTSENVFNSLVTSWNLTTCFQHIGSTFDVRRFLTSLQAIGFTVGGIVSGPLADHYGRKWLVFAGNFVMIFFGIGSSFAPNWKVLGACLFLMSFCRSVTVMPQIVHGIESVPKKYRLTIGVASQWELAYILSAVLAFLVRDWRKFILYSNIVCLPMVLLLAFFSESPRWLIEKGRFSQAANSLNWIAGVNGKKTRISETEIADNFPEICPPNHSFPFIDLLKSIFNHLRAIATTKSLLIVLALAVVIRATESIIDVSFQFNLNDFITSPFVSIGAYGLIRLWCPILAILLDVRYQWFSRRLYALSSLLTMLLLNLAAVISAILMLSPGDNTTAHLTMTIFFILADVINNGLLYSAITQIVAEHFPTTMRSTALSILSIAAGLGEVFGNLILELQPFWHPAPYVVVEGLLVGGFIGGFFLLPETKGKELKDRL